MRAVSVAPCRRTRHESRDPRSAGERDRPDRQYRSDGVDEGGEADAVQDADLRFHGGPRLAAPHPGAAGRSRGEGVEPMLGCGRRSIHQNAPNVRRADSMIWAAPSWTKSLKGARADPSLGTASPVNPLPRRVRPDADPAHFRTDSLGVASASVR